MAGDDIAVGYPSQENPALSRDGAGSDV